MKQQFVRTAMLAALVLLASCKDETPAYVEPTPDPSAPQFGYLSIGMSGLSVLIDAETDQDSEAASPTRAGVTDPGVPQGDEVAVKSAGEVPDAFKIRIEPEQGGDPLFDGTYGELKKAMAAETDDAGNPKPAGLVAPVGKYTLLATSNTTAAGKPSAVQQMPSYAAFVEDITVAKEQTSHVEEVTCKLQNIKVTVTLAADLREKLVPLDVGYELGQLIEASVSYADAPEICWKIPSTWDWTQTDPKPVYFPALQEGGTHTLKLTFTARLAGEEAPTTITKEIPGILQGQWRRIKVIPKYDTTGNVYFDVEISSFVQDEEIVVGDGKDAALSVKWRELPYEEPAQEPSMSWSGGGEIPATLDPREAKDKSVIFSVPGGIETFGVRFTATNSEFAGDVSVINSLGDLTAVSSNRTLTNYGIPFGAALKGQTSVTMPLNKIAEQLADYEGTYTFTFSFAGSTRAAATELTLTFVNGSGSGGGSDSGEAPSIVWHMAGGAIGTLYDETGFGGNGQPLDVPFVEMSEDMVVELELVANPNFKAIKVVITSDSLNEDVLTEMNIPPVFDLCNLQTYTYKDRVISPEAQMAVLSSLKLSDKFNEDMKRQHTTSFNITEFVSVMISFCNSEEKVQFSLTVEDAQGRSVTKYLRLRNIAK